MSHTNKLTSLLTVITFICAVFSYDDFRFQRVIDCVDVDSKGVCKNWNQTTTLYRYTVSLYYCFPGDSYVLTAQGPKQFQQLQIHDQLFAMNLQTGKNGFSPLISWLHRDATSLMNYSLIQVQNSQWSFLGSEYHNIAFSSENQTDFKFLKDLNPNDALVSFSATNQNFIVKSIEEHEEKQGLFSPYTQAGTFYIFPENFNMQKYLQNQDSYPMILVHCLSQVSNPTKNQGIVEKYTAVSSGVLGSSQPDNEEEYVSPLISTFRMMFGDDWVSVEGEKIAHRYTSSSYSSTARSQEREQRKRKTVAMIALETVLAHCLL